MSDIDPLSEKPFDDYWDLEAEPDEEDFEDDYYDDVPRCPECDACVTMGDAHDSECPYA